MRGRRDPADRARHLDARGRLRRQRVQHRCPGVAGGRNELLEHRRGRRRTIRRAIDHRSGQDGRVGEAGIGQKGADLHIGVVAGLEQPIELQDQPLADDDRRVRLLDRQRSSFERAVEPGGVSDCRDERATRGGQLGPGGNRTDEAAPHVGAFRDEVAIRAAVIGEGNLEDHEGAIAERGSVDLADRRDRPLLGAEPARPPQLVRRHHPALGQSSRNRTMGHATPARNQVWSGTSIASPMCS